jgi:hypothetical protein
LQFIIIPESPTAGRKEILGPDKRRQGTLADSIRLKISWTENLTLS